MTHTHIVTRALSGPNGLIPIGTAVDASKWRNAARLVETRYLKPIDRTIGLTEIRDDANRISVNETGGPAAGAQAATVETGSKADSGSKSGTSSAKGQQKEKEKK